MRLCELRCGAKLAPVLDVISWCRTKAIVSLTEPFREAWWCEVMALPHTMRCTPSAAVLRLSVVVVIAVIVVVVVGSIGSIGSIVRGNKIGIAPFAYPRRHACAIRQCQVDAKVKAN